MPMFIPSKNAALDRVNQYVSEKLIHYQSKRNHDFGGVDANYVSYLSPYLRHRVITEEYVIKQALSLYPFNKIEKFIQEILWRTYWKGWLQLRPKVWGDYKRDLEKIKLNHNLNDILEYKTDIECFNDWTKELIENNYLHNHVRMWYASIWIHTLKLPWQLGADFFMKYLFDGDPASNTLSWRWVAGLQTRDKSYLATKSNIHKFTGGRCSLKDHALATLPVNHTFLDYPPNSMKFNEMIDIEWDENTGLLITCEDLDLETATDIVFPVQHAYMLVATPEENGVYSNSVLNFKKELCLDVVNNINKKIHSVSNSDEIDLVSWIQENKLKKIVTLSTPVGYINDYLNGKKNEMKDYSVEFVKIFREYDMKFWNFANKGFFNFFQKAKTKLAN